jgi:hypothetical protein
MTPSYHQTGISIHDFDVQLYLPLVPAFWQYLRFPGFVRSLHVRHTWTHKDFTWNARLIWAFDGSVIHTRAVVASPLQLVLVPRIVV